MRKPFLIILSALFLTPALAQTEGYSHEIQAVDEYVPAPGQFINTMPPYEEGDDVATMAQKCTAYLASPDPTERGAVCLGAYGGYLTFHFDHPVANVPGERDFAIFGNSMQTQMYKPEVVWGGSAEPGIVMVSQDTNRNGLPDDEWFELSGSADTDSIDALNPSLDWERRLIYNYEITYTRDGDLNAVPWYDNQGQQGEVPRNSYHEQEYWPLWMAQEELTFEGTRLPKNAWFFEKNKYNKQWILMFLDHGYADNRQNVDTLGCAFDLSWAVVPQTRQPVTITHADFIRVYTAMNQEAGSLGETSTEVAGAIDLHLEASIEAMNSYDGQPTIIRSAETPQQPKVLYQMGTLKIVRTEDGIVKKVLLNKDKR